MTTTTATSVSSVALRPLRTTDGPRIRKWMRDIEIVGMTVVVTDERSLGPVPFAAAESDAYLRSLRTDVDRRCFAIEHDGDHVGNIGIKDFYPPAIEAACFVEIGEVSARGKGVALRSMASLLDVAFTQYGLVRVTLGVFPFNVAALALYRRLGFVEDGMEGYHHVSGKRYTILRMVIDTDRWTHTGAALPRATDVQLPDDATSAPLWAWT